MALAGIASSASGLLREKDRPPNWRVFRLNAEFVW
jgi:hypothetical protein